MPPSDRPNTVIRQLRQGLAALLRVGDEDKTRGASRRIARGRQLSRIEVLESRILLAVGVGDDNFSIGDQLRHYRLAIAATSQYTQFHGGQADSFAEIQNVVDDLNEIFERELSIHFDLVSTIDTVFTDSASDGFTNGDVIAMINQNPAVLNAAYGSGGYDIGHVFGVGNEGGLAGLGVVGTAIKGVAASTSASPVGNAWVHTVAHEIGHQFGASHTFNASVLIDGSDARHPQNAFEPASGTTLMSYAGSAEDGDNLQGSTNPVFHSASLEQIEEYIASTGVANTATETGNSIPSVNAGSDYTIPARTPFRLLAIGNDADIGDRLTYTWDQLDIGGAQGLPVTDDGNRPLFRSNAPSEENDRSFPDIADLAAGLDTNAIGEALPTTSRNLNFRTSVRDGFGGVGSDDLLLRVVDTGAPFAITSTGSDNWIGDSNQSITWNVAGTDSNGIDEAFVGIDLSMDGGLTYPISIVESTPNNGSFSFNAPNVEIDNARIRVRSLNNVFFAISDADFSIAPSAPSPGITISETDGTTIVGEDGLIDGQPIDTYEIARTTVGAGMTTVAIEAAAEIEISSDGINFYPKLTIKMVRDVPRTIAVRGVDDSIDEGIQGGMITHTVIDSTDPDYSAATPIQPVSVTIADDEIQPLIGVDFDTAGGQSPANWNRVADALGGTYTDLLREDGLATNINLDIAAQPVASVYQSDSFTHPAHSPSLVGVDGVLSGTESVVLTWSGLSPDSNYNLYVFGLESEAGSYVQEVNIAGGTNAHFTQPLSDGELFINGSMGSAGSQLSAFAQLVTSDMNGEIEVSISPGTESAGISLAGIAIQPIAQPTDRLTLTIDAESISERGGTTFATIARSLGTNGDVTVTLSSDDPSEVVVPSSVVIVDGTDSVSFPIDGLDDQILDGTQTVTIVASGAGFAQGIDTLEVTDNEVTIPGEFVGVDFGNAPSPTNWTFLQGTSPSTSANLTDESGHVTEIDLTIESAGGLRTGEITPNAATIPTHDLDLSTLDGQIFTNRNRLTATWSDLDAGTMYEVYLFGLEGYFLSIEQDVTIIGGGDPIEFQQSFAFGDMFINDALGSASHTLSDYAQVVKADESGNIVIEIDPVAGGNDVVVAGMAIRELVAVTPPSIIDVTINDGASQRSSLTEIEVVFDQEVLAPASAFTVRDRDSNIVVDTLVVDSTVVDGRTFSRLTFTAGDDVIGGGLNSLIDGNYLLEIAAAQIVSSENAVSMQIDYVHGESPADAFFRKYGDSDGNDIVDSLDLADFQQAYGTRAGESRYLGWFDSDGDNSIGLLDFASFRSNFGN